MVTKSQKKGSSKSYRAGSTWRDKKKQHTISGGISSSPSTDATHSRSDNIMSSPLKSPKNDRGQKRKLSEDDSLSAEGRSKRPRSARDPYRVGRRVQPDLRKVALVAGYSSEESEGRSSVTDRKTDRKTPSDPKIQVLVQNGAQLNNVMSTRSKSEEKLRNTDNEPRSRISDNSRIKPPKSTEHDYETSIRKRDISRSSKPDESRLSKQNESRSRKSDESRSSKPDESRSSKPDESRSSKPDESRSSKPDEFMLSKPGKFRSSKPDESRRRGPDESRRNKIDESNDFRKSKSDKSSRKSYESRSTRKDAYDKSNVPVKKSNRYSNNSDRSRRRKPDDSVSKPDKSRGKGGDLRTDQSSRISEESHKKPTKSPRETDGSRGQVSDKLHRGPSDSTTDRPSQSRSKPEKTQRKPEEFRTKPDEYRTKPRESRSKPKEPRRKSGESGGKPDNSHKHPESSYRRSCSSSSYSSYTSSSSQSSSKSRSKSSDRQKSKINPKIIDKSNTSRQKSSDKSQVSYEDGQIHSSKPRQTPRKTETSSRRSKRKRSPTSPRSRSRSRSHRSHKSRGDRKSTDYHPEKRQSDNFISKSDNRRRVQWSPEPANRPRKRGRLDMATGRSRSRDTAGRRSPRRSRQPVRSQQSSRQAVRSQQRGRQPVRSPQRDRQPVRSPRRDRQPVRSPRRGRQPVKSPQRGHQPVRSQQRGRQPVRSPRRGLLSQKTQLPGRASRYLPPRIGTSQRAKVDVGRRKREFSDSSCGNSPDKRRRQTSTHRKGPRSALTKPPAYYRHRGPSFVPSVSRSRSQGRGRSRSQDRSPLRGGRSRLQNRSRSISLDKRSHISTPQSQRSTSTEIRRNLIRPPRSLSFSPKKLSEREREKHSEREREKLSEREREKHSEREREKLSEREREKHSEREREKPSEREREKSSESMSGKPSDIASEKHSEKPSEREREKQSESESEKPSESEREKPSERERERSRSHSEVKISIAIPYRQKRTPRSRSRSSRSPGRRSDLLRMGRSRSRSPQRRRRHRHSRSPRHRQSRFGPRRQPLAVATRKDGRVRWDPQPWGRRVVADPECGPMMDFLPADFAHKWTQVHSDPARRTWGSYLSNPFSPEQLGTFWDECFEKCDFHGSTGSYGRSIPRKAAWYTSAGCSCTYKYSGTQWPALDPPQWLSDVESAVMACLGPCLAETGLGKPNSVNINLYENGFGSVGWHSDNEPLFEGKHSPALIVSLSLGATRTFDWKLGRGPDEERQSASLKSGDVMTMEGMFQKYYVHRVGKEPHVRQPRINMTWRWISKHIPTCPMSRLPSERQGWRLVKSKT
eukprot:874322_1